MRVNKKFFLRAVKYLRKINKESIFDLDLSEFKENHEMKKEFDFIGLNNVDYIKFLLEEE